MARRPARGRSTRKSGSPGWLWFVAGLLLGLGVATWAVIQGYIPQPKQSPGIEKPVTAQPRSKADKPILEETSKKPRYDFFTVLEEVEVAVPEKELRQQAQTEARLGLKDAAVQSIPGDGSYIIQVGSFRNPRDAEAMKARLAFLGAQAHIQKVTINDKSWQRVRIGPFDSAQEVAELQASLKDNGIDSRVFKAR